MDEPKKFLKQKKSKKKNHKILKAQKDLYHKTKGP